MATSSLHGRPGSSLAPIASIALALAGPGLWVVACSSDGSGGGGAGGGKAASSSSGSSGTSAGGGTSTSGSGDAGPGSSSTTGSGSGTGGAGGAGACPPEPAGPPPALKLTRVVNGLSKPVLAIGAPGDLSRLYIVEQTGQIKILKDGEVLADPFLSTAGLSSSGRDPNSERGLLGLAFHPAYEQNGRFFIYYTSSEDAAITIAEYRRSDASPDRANPQATRTLVRISDGLHPWGNHNGGMLAFGPDGYLHAGVGDGGGEGDPNGHGQDVNLKLGKLLRIDVDDPSASPPGNLPGGDPHVWDYGLRNPWRFSFDRCTGDIYIGDVGQGAREEIDVEPARQGGKNYGWDITEGTRCFGSASCDTAGITMPVVEYPHTSTAPYAGKCSVTGGFVYRGTRIPNLVGTYFYADYCSNQIFTLVWKDGALQSQADVTADLESSDFLGISSFGEDTRGELYVLDVAGAVYRIDAE
jgi:glucose/arabinose dehydrogenase